MIANIIKRIESIDEKKFTIDTTINFCLITAILWLGHYYSEQEALIVTLGWSIVVLVAIIVVGVVNKK